MESLTVFYDSNCSFCTNIKNIIVKLDANNQIKFEALDDGSDKLWAKDADGKEYYSEEVVGAVSRLLPGIKRFAWMFKGKAGEKAEKLFYEGLEKVKKMHMKVTNGDCANC